MDDDILDYNERNKLEDYLNVDGYYLGHPCNFALGINYISVRIASSTVTPTSAAIKPKT